MKTIGLRDNICVKGEKTTCGSKMLENFISPYNSTVVERLNNAGVNIEKLAINEFGIGEDKNVKEFLETNLNVKTIILTDGNGEIARNTTDGMIRIKTYIWCNFKVWSGFNSPVDGASSEY